MKRFIRTAIIPALAVAGLMTAVAGVPSVAGAETLKTATIAILDQRRLFSESLVSQDITKQLRQFSQTFGNEENNTKNALLKEKEELEKQRPVIGEAMFEQKFNALRTKADQLNRKMDLHQKQLNVAQMNTNRELQKVLAPIISKLSDSKGANVVLEKSQVVHSTAALDMTTEVIELLNKQLPTLKVTLPTEAEIVDLEKKAGAAQP
ncbi:OmpH/Skp family outer membrane protein [Govanella unica]|uniref:OmpH family outer membrane protein n=1 Tax=Govanella unica TaxID=2975056 RepID=A0A9X3TXG1_9PROT|nr:OmpH family outer membrane protein [Govania unica]MDA5193775.1 OmpH family outer membrane protein [Govania unica]